jgi:hypothetical protein
MLSAFPLTLMADASAAADAMRSYITPVLATMIGLASVAVVFFLVYGGIQYMTSAGSPDKLESAKKILRNALIGLVIVIAAGTLTGILSHAYSSPNIAPAESMPAMTKVEPKDPGGGLVTVLIDAITGLLQYLIQAVASPFIDALTYFTHATPLMADNSSVFNLWLAILGIADVLFIAVVALLGFHVMSASALGLDEIELKHLLPQLAFIFLLMNMSIFAIDAVISLSNAMIDALRAGFPDTTVWESLTSVVDKSGGIGLAALLIMVVFVIVAVMLLIYYVLRIVTLYIGAVLSPLILLLWLLPAFKDFAVTAAKVYLTTIFVLFVHVVILLLAASIFIGMADASPNGTLNPIMAMIVGVATLLALLKTQSVMSQMSYVSLGPKTARKLGGQISNVVNHYGSKTFRAARGVRNASYEGGGGNTVVVAKQPTRMQGGSKAKTSGTKLATSKTRAASAPKNKKEES